MVAWANPYNIARFLCINANLYINVNIFLLNYFRHFWQIQIQHINQWKVLSQPSKYQYLTTNFLDSMVLIDFHTLAYLFWNSFELADEYFQITITSNSTKSILVVKLTLNNNNQWPSKCCLKWYENLSKTTCYNH